MTKKKNEEIIDLYNINVLFPAAAEVRAPLPHPIPGRGSSSPGTTTLALPLELFIITHASPRCIWMIRGHGGDIQARGGGGMAVIIL